MTLTPQQLLDGPDGVVCTPNGDMHVQFDALRRCLRQAGVTGASFVDMGILAIVGFGSAFRRPRRFRRPILSALLRRDVWRTESLNPHDVDFLVLTSQPSGAEKWIRPTTRETYGGYYVVSNGIHCVSRGLDQFRAGIATREDSVSVTALIEGVVLWRSPDAVGLLFPSAFDIAMQDIDGKIVMRVIHA